MSSPAPIGSSSTLRPLASCSVIVTGIEPPSRDISADVVLREKAFTSTESYKKVNMACTEQKKKLLKRRRKHGIRSKNNTTLFDRLPKMRIVNDSKILGPVNGKKIDIDEFQINLPLKKKVSKLSTVTQVPGTGEAMRPARALTCRTLQLEPDVLEGAHWSRNQ
ncbi:hypothetical protein MSG28_000350 [Choristoneura fumiferana]|uniref:Uncharacterized protein n=1 Tax=Choristoneura fumiferana TaxID=7141 RepID=A0ACC0K092_CHOFU|nr:hypothetical protein MSG28_000350 [Choristoneura fumiferana]